MECICAFERKLASAPHRPARYNNASRSQKQVIGELSNSCNKAQKANSSPLVFCSAPGVDIDRIATRCCGAVVMVLELNSDRQQS
jgi:hypothetical protein